MRDPRVRVEDVVSVPDDALFVTLDKRRSRKPASGTTGGRPLNAAPDGSD